MKAICVSEFGGPEVLKLEDMPDPRPNVNLFHDLNMLAYRGRVVVVGSRGKVEINPRDIMTREAAGFGVFLWEGARSRSVGGACRSSGGIGKRNPASGDCCGVAPGLGS
jgi:hypothetical protein